MIDFSLLNFQKNYAIRAVILLILELLIALFVHDSIVRPYIGDALVVLLLYWLVRSFVRTSVQKAALAVLVFSYLVEGLQAVHLIHLLDWEQSLAARLILGHSFDWMDMLMYTIGYAFILLSEYRGKSAQHNSSVQKAA